MKLFYFAFLFCGSFIHIVNASTPVDSIPVEIKVIKSGASAVFEAELPELKGVPGGRQPFYTYLWDFGDGHFSQKERPQHVYADSGNYTVNLYVVNNYDDGPRPKRRAKEIQIAATSD